MANRSVNLPRISPWLWAFTAVVVGIVAAQIYGRGAFFLVAAGAVLLGVISVLWSSLLSLTGDAPLTLDEALSLAAPSAEEERKESVLRALKDLEYERNVGKLSDEDYRELSRKYRHEAKQLLQLVDENLAPARARAMELVEQRLKELDGQPDASQNAVSSADAKPGAATTPPDGEARDIDPPTSEKKA